MLTLGNVQGRETDTQLRWRFPWLPAPLVLPWSELPVLGLDGSTPWLYGPIERDPLAVHGRTPVPRRELRLLRRAAERGVPFQRVAFAHELDPGGEVRHLLAEVRDGPRMCTSAVAEAVVGPQPLHPAVRGAVRVLDAAVGRGAARAVATMLDPIVFGVIGEPDTEAGRPALFYPICAWRW